VTRCRLTFSALQGPSVSQRFFHRRSRKASGSLSPLPPLRSLRGSQGLQPPAPSGMFPYRKPPLSHFHALLRVSHPQAPLPTGVLGRPEATLKSSSLELRRPSAFSDAGTLLLASLEASGDRCPGPRKSHPQGLATLSVTSVPAPLGTSLSSPRSWAFPFRAFLLHRDRKDVSTSPSAPALPIKTFPASIRRSDGFLPR